MNEYKEIDLRELILKCRERDDSAFSELLSRYTPMIKKVISDYGVATLDYGELYSEGCVALHLAAASFDLSQTEVTFGLYARICVKRRILDLLRRSSEGVGIVDIDTTDVSSEIEPERAVLERETVDILMRSAASLLSDYEYKVFLLHIQGYKTASIAKMLGHSAKSVDNAKFRLFKRLREALGGVLDI